MSNLVVEELNNHEQKLKVWKVRVDDRLEASRGVQIEPMEAWDFNSRCNDFQADGDKAGSDQQAAKQIP